MALNKTRPIFLGSYTLNTPVGSMIAVGDQHTLYVLDFADKQNLQKRLEQLQATLKATIISEKTASINLIEEELASYFAGTLQQFKTPIAMVGTPFAQSTWQQLINIPYGQTKSYAQLATMVGNQKAYRAVARANSINRLAIIIPCHRVINSSGELGGYAGGIAYKKWLIEHETQFLKK